jgi:hypothetical protein
VGGVGKLTPIYYAAHFTPEKFCAKEAGQVFTCDQMYTMLIKIEPTRESELAKVLGMSRKNLSDLRVKSLRPELDWYREETNAPEARRPVWITAEGVVALSVILGLKTEQIEAEKKNFSVASATETVECLVVQAFPRNPTLVQVIAGGQPRMMRVKDNRKWAKGMKVMARQEQGMSKFLIPLRNPRFFGRF